MRLHFTELLYLSRLQGLAESLPAEPTIESAVLTREAP